MFISSFTGFGLKMASKPCVFWSESIAHGRSNAGAVLLLHSTTAGSMIISETKLHHSEIYISHSITKSLHNDARPSLIGLSRTTKHTPYELVFGQPPTSLLVSYATLKGKINEDLDDHVPSIKPLGRVPQSGEFVQVLLTNRNHWITISTIGRQRSSINVF